MVVMFGDGGFKYLDHDAYIDGGNLKLSILKDNLKKDPESGWPFVEHYLTAHLSRQLEYRTNHPDDYLNSPIYTSDFYARYNRFIGKHERHSTTDQQQLTNRLVHHPKYLKTARSLYPIQFSFIGCGSGRDNVDSNVINNALSYYPRLFRKTVLVGIEPHPPKTGINTYLNPFYEQNLESVSLNRRETNATDGAFLLGSPRMDMLYFLDRLKSMIALNTILKTGGFVAIDEACPAASMPLESASNAYLTQERENLAAHSWMPEGYFYRTWRDENGEFGKYFYAEPFELYYTLMRQAGFKLTLGSYSEISKLFGDERLSTKKTEWQRVLARSLPPNNLFDHIFYQSNDTERVFNRYVLLWEKESQPQSQLINFIAEFENYEASLRHRLKQQLVN